MLEAFLLKRKAPHEGSLSSVLEIYGKLVSSSHTEKQGFDVLNTAIENLGFEAISPYMRHVWAPLLKQLRNEQRTPKFDKNLIMLMSRFLLKDGSQNLADSVNAVQPNVFQDVLEQCWIPDLKVTALHEGSLSSVLEIYGKLVLSSSTEDQGFDVLNTVIEIHGFEAISPYSTQVWAPLLKQLRNEQRTPKFEKNLIMLMSRFLLRHGSPKLVNTVNAAQRNAFLVVLEQCWIPQLKLITTSPIELNLTCVASTRLICESLDTLHIMGNKLCGKMLNNLVTLLSRHEQVEGLSPPKKKHKTGKEEDPLKEIKDAREFLVVSLSNMGQRKYHPVIDQLEETNRSALLQLLDLYKA